MRVIDERGLVYDSRYICHTTLSNQKYAIPNLKKYPLPDKAHVKSAIKFFNYVSPRYEKTLAYAILKRMDEYGMSFDDMTIGDENRFKKYIPKREYLAHHGIMGMHWGVRHDHYPLNASEHTAAEKKAGWKKSLDNNGTVPSTKASKHKKSFGKKVGNALKTTGRVTYKAAKATVRAGVKVARSEEGQKVIEYAKNHPIKTAIGIKVGKKVAKKAIRKLALSNPPVQAAMKGKHLASEYFRKRKKEKQGYVFLQDQWGNKVETDIYMPGFNGRRRRFGR